LSFDRRVFQVIQNAKQAREVFELLTAMGPARGVQVREPPPEPLGCCARSCQGCVWEGFVAAAEFWRERTVMDLRLEP